ncbi:hypothetical protein STRDD12_01008 [Streptococcus sp. DD12]|nr:hypothetical protein STRDD12_01008 [Streptococcus sp. DD12]
MCVKFETKSNKASFYAEGEELGSLRQSNVMFDGLVWGH